MTDTERLSWLEEKGYSLLHDDAGNWAVVSGGCQSISENMPMDLTTQFFIEAGQFKKSTREAIDAAIEEEVSP